MEMKDSNQVLLLLGFGLLRRESGNKNGNRDVLQIS